ncbi:sensor histidine kinase [Actinoplanes aureus]|uniref:Sensor histidine kinase n=1 Tax=Actinoplanes aureus TaxID=2792083 RepID=A0A931C4N9_9ACTN|nr:sensor histidine kinase [Actinoplanes aureus]MBG0560393.1 sensor histidine kinase [Actinoplanes aureus]
MITFDHPALFYRDVEQYLSGTTDFVRSAVAAGDAVLVAVPGGNLTLLRDALSDLGRQVTFADMAVAGRNPGRIIPGVLLSFVAAHPGRRVSIIGEPVWPGRSVVEYPACVAHEALINKAFIGRNAVVLCPYDAKRLRRERLDDALRTHPFMIVDEVRRESRWYADPLVTAALCAGPLPPAPASAPVAAYAGPTDLSRVRRFVTGCAEAGGLCPERAADLVLAVNELAVNTIQHTGGGGAVTVWSSDEYVYAQVDDRGDLADPLAGQIPPHPDREDGRGLILVNDLCDLVRVHTRREGTTIRLHMAR